MIERYFLIVDNGEVIDWHDTLAAARQAVKERYNGSSIVRAVTADGGPWACGVTFREAETNLRKGIFDNWSDCQ